MLPSVYPTETPLKFDDGPEFARRFHSHRFGTSEEPTSAALSPIGLREHLITSNVTPIWAPHGREVLSARHPMIGLSAHLGPR